MGLAGGRRGREQEGRRRRRQHERGSGEGQGGGRVGGKPKHPRLTTVATRGTASSACEPRVGQLRGRDAPRSLHAAPLLHCTLPPSPTPTPSSLSRSELTRASKCSRAASPWPVPRSAAASPPAPDWLYSPCFSLSAHRPLLNTASPAGNPWPPQHPPPPHPTNPSPMSGLSDVPNAHAALLGRLLSCCDLQLSGSL